MYQVQCVIWQIVATSSVCGLRARVDCLSVTVPFVWVDVVLVVCPCWFNEKSTISIIVVDN